MRRLLPVVMVIAALASGCVTDQSTDGVTPQAWCASAASLVEPLQQSGGQPGTPGVAEAIAAFDAELGIAEDDLRTGEQFQDLVELSAVNVDELGDADRRRWDSALVSLDAAVDARCAFSIVLLIDSSRSGGAPEDVAFAGAIGESLTVDDIAAVVAGTAWSDEAYSLTIGQDPDTLITVGGVDEAEAMIVCTDLSAALANTRIVVADAAGRGLVQAGPAGCAPVYDLLGAGTP